MKFKKLSILIFSLILLIPAMKVDASIGKGNVYCSETIAQQVWFTKLIKFDNFKGKDISGTPNFELVPDKTASKKSLTNNDPNNGEFDRICEVVPGLINHTYRVPFSSNDYVDKKFNDLAWQSGAFNGSTEDLFNHSFIHEWGRIETSDHQQTYRVGKLYPEQFRNADLQLSEEEAKEMYDSQKEELASDEEVNRCNWAGDPDSAGVLGWKSYFGELGYNGKDHLYDFLGAYDFGSQFLNFEDDFRDGTMKVIDKFNFYNNAAVNYLLKMTTRPIAIDKKFDANGNIESIEKPLIPSKDANNFIGQHNQYLNDKYDNPHDYAYNKIFRYKLIEKEADGVEMKLPSKELIVDVIAFGNIVSTDTDCGIYVFEDEKSADAFYQRLFKGLDENESNDVTLLETKGKVEKSDKVQLINESKNNEDPKPEKPNTNKEKKPKKDSPKTGDSDMGLLFMGIAGLGIAGLAISMKKKKSN